MKKYYKFIFITLFGLFLFLPKDTYAVQSPFVEGIYVYNDAWYSVANCYGSSCSDNDGKIEWYAYSNLERIKYVRVYLNYDFYTNQKYSVDFKFTTSYQLPNFNSYVNVNRPLIYASGTQQNLISPTWSLLNQNDNSITFSRNYSFTSSFTSSVDDVGSSYSPYIQFEINDNVDFAYFSFNIDTLSISNVGEDNSSIIQNSTQNIINNQNINTDKIIESNEDIKKEQEKTNEELGELNDNLTSEDSPDLDSLNDSAGWLPPGPVDGILNLPLTFFNSLTSSLSKSCEPVNVPLPYVNKNITLPCVSTLLEQMGATNFFDFLGILAGVIILYNYFLNLYKWVDNTIQMKDNSVDDWGGV